MCLPGVGEGVLTKENPLTLGVSVSSSFPSTPILVDGLFNMFEVPLDLLLLAGVSPLNGTLSNLVFV